MQITLKSKLIKLRRLTKEDLPDLINCANNIKIWNNLRDMMPHPYTQKDADLYFDMVSNHATQKNFAIEYEAKFVGMIGIHPQFDVYKKSAEIGYWIGEPYWGNGIATEAVKLITQYGLSDLGLIRIYAGIFAFNPASGRVLEKAGFKREGVSRNAIFKNGKISDEVRYAILA